MSADHLARVERACVELTDTGAAVTFTAVAARSGVGRATLPSGTMRFDPPSRVGGHLELCRFAGANAGSLSLRPLVQSIGYRPPGA